MVAVPRLARYGEHVDDHQTELAMQLHQMHLLRACLNVEQLPDSLKGLKSHGFDSFHSNTGNFLASLDAYIRTL